MDKFSSQWFAQADYDLDTAEYMFKGGRFFYAVFMAHLAIEKALKGWWQARLQAVPPKTHNLRYLAERIGAVLPEEIDVFLTTLNDLSVPTRYPDDLARLAAEYTPARTREILTHTRESLAWIKEQQ